MNRQRLRALLRDTRATVALETALAMPIMLLLMVGAWELYAYMRAASIVDRTAFTVADTLSRKSRLIDNASTSDGDNLGVYYLAARQVADPLDLANGGSLIISAVYNDGTNTTITWQRRAPFSDPAENSRLGIEGQAPTLVTTDGTAIPLRTGEIVIVAEVFLPFRPFLWSRAAWSDAPLSVTLYHRAVYMARYGGIHVLQSSPTSSSPPASS